MIRDVVAGYWRNNCEEIVLAILLLFILCAPLRLTSV